ncbi:MAG: hypothetical protein KJO40_13490 [Deltaproteobacteria bacterium]|nr:hypothetical protein [Deltaproteobacteria bacterium]
MSYYSDHGIGQFQPGVFGARRGADMPTGVPGPASPMHPTPAMPASLFPTNAKWGDVVTVQGNFAGLHQGEVLVRFAGAPAQAIALTSAYGGSVVVPQGAQSGACQVEVQGRQVFGGSCVISEGRSGPSLPAQAPEHAAVRAWKDFGPKTALLGLGDTMTYHADSYEGVGAIAASRIGASPTARVIKGVSTVARPSATVKPVLPGVGVRSVTSTRAPVIVDRIPATTRLPSRAPSLAFLPPKVQIGTGIGTRRPPRVMPSPLPSFSGRCPAGTRLIFPGTRSERCTPVFTEDKWQPKLPTKPIAPIAPAPGRMYAGGSPGWTSKSPTQSFAPPPEAEEAELVVDADVLAPAPEKPGMSPTVKLALVGAAAAAVYFMFVRKP